MAASYYVGSSTQNIRVRVDNEGTADRVLGNGAGLLWLRRTSIGRGSDWRVYERKTETGRIRLVSVFVYSMGSKSSYSPSVKTRSSGVPEEPSEPPVFL